MKDYLAFLRERFKNYFIFYTPWVVSTWVLAIALKTLDVLILNNYNALGYRLQFSDLPRVWILDISLISLIWFIALAIIFFCNIKYLKYTHYFFSFIWFIYSFLSIFFSYYTAFSELLPDSILFTYNNQNARLLFSTYAYLLIPFFIWLIVALLLLWFNYLIIRRISLKIHRWVFLFLFIFTIVPTRNIFLEKTKSEEKRVVYMNKVCFFIKSIFYNFYNNEIVNTSKFDYKTIFNKEFAKEQFISDDFPLLRHRDTNDVLSPYFKPFDKKPNLVFIIVESLGRNYSGPDALYGSFTPFLDSLAQNSLYWYNFLATSGRTFEAMPSIFASVPYGPKGFNELSDSFPTHSSLLRNLKHNGYFISFFYGGWTNFDNMASFLEYNHADYIIKAFPKHYKKMGNENYSWGYDDRTLFNHSLCVLDSFPNKPRVDIYLTLSNHNPWNYIEIEKYEKKLDKYFVAHPDFYSKQTTYYIKKRYATVLYTDDVLRQFFEAYKKRPEFENTIFIITGDHGLSYDQNYALKKFHVPLIIYSPKLRKSAIFKGVSSHLDIAPSMEQLLKSKVGLSLPNWTCYLGNRLDTSRYFNINRPYSFIWENKTFPDVLSDNFYLYKDSLFIVSDNFIQRSIFNSKVNEDMKQINNALALMHQRLPLKNKIMPFSTFINQYAVQIYPECKNISKIEQYNVFKISSLNEGNEYTNIFSLSCKQNDFGLLHILGSMQCKLQSANSTTFQLVFEARDSAQNIIGWQSYEIALKSGENKLINLNRYFIFKQMNTYVPIKYVNAYFWNYNKASVKIIKFEMKTYIE